MQIIERQEGDLDRLRVLIRQEPAAMQRDRLHCVVLAIEGDTEPQITTMAWRSRGFVQRWVYAYRDGGIDAITPGQRGGSRPRLLDNDTAAFLARLRAGPDPQADGMATALAGKDCQRILREQFGSMGCINCCTDTAFHACVQGPCIAKPTATPNNAGSTTPLFCPACPRRTPRLTRRGLVSRRGEVRPTGHIYRRVGTQGFTAGRGQPAHR